MFICKILNDCKSFLGKREDLISGSRTLTLKFTLNISALNAGKLLPPATRIQLRLIEIWIVRMLNILFL